MFLSTLGQVPLKTNYFRIPWNLLGSILITCQITSCAACHREIFCFGHLFCIILKRPCNIWSKSGHSGQSVGLLLLGGAVGASSLGLFAAFLLLWGPTPPKTAGCWRSHTRWWCHPLGRRWYYEVGALRLWGCWQPRKTDARGSLYILLLLKARRGCSAENLHIYIWRAAKVYFKYQDLPFRSTIVLEKISSHLISKWREVQCRLFGRNKILSKRQNVLYLLA